MIGISAVPKSNNIGGRMHRPSVAPFVPEQGSRVWFQRPDLVDSEDPVSRFRQRSLIISFGIGPFVVELVEPKKIGTANAGVVVVISTSSGPREVPASRLVPEQPTTFKNNAAITWVDPRKLNGHSAHDLASYKEQYGPGPFAVENAVPAHPFDQGSDLITFQSNGKDGCLPARFFVLA